MDWHEIGKTSLSATAVSAAIGSTITKTLLYPVDTVKCRMQSLGKAGNYSKIFLYRGMFNGLIPKIALYAPYQSVYMTSYTWARDKMTVYNPTLPLYASFAVSGIVAELAGSVIRLPMEVLKQRMQTGSISNTRKAVSELLSNPGNFYAFKNFRAQTLFYDIPCGVLHWTFYEHFKRSADWSLSPGTSGALAGTVTAVLTNPLDVVKTRIITRGSEKGHERISCVIKTVWAESGIRGFWRGVLPRVLHIAPNSALYMWIFDTVFRLIEHS